jgi:hypothetical protein
METSNKVPHAREDGLMVRELPDEVLVYDLGRHKAHCLNSTAALIWKHCDGKSSVADIAARLGNELQLPVDEEVVWIGVRRLGRANLLQTRVTPPADVVRKSRREVMQKLALIGGVSVASILLPTAAEAASKFTSCKHVLKNGVPENGQCCNGSKGICHITSDGNGTCGPETC